MRYRCPPMTRGRRLFIPLGADGFPMKPSTAATWPGRKTHSRASVRRPPCAIGRSVGGRWDPVSIDPHRCFAASSILLCGFAPALLRGTGEREIRFVPVRCNRSQACGWVRAWPPIDGLLRHCHLSKGGQGHVRSPLLAGLRLHRPCMRACMDLALRCGPRWVVSLAPKRSCLRKSPQGGEVLWVKIPKTPKNWVRIKCTGVTGVLQLLLEPIRACGIARQSISGTRQVSPCCSRENFAANPSRPERRPRRSSNG